MDLKINTIPKPKFRLKSSNQEAPSKIKHYGGLLAHKFEHVFDLSDATDLKEKHQDIQKNKRWKVLGIVTTKEQ
jgi:hypothetical protein